MPETSPGHVLHWADNQAIVYVLCIFSLAQYFRVKAKRLETLFWCNLFPSCLYVPLIKTLSSLFNADAFVSHRSIYTSCTARPNQGPSNWVVKGTAAGDVRFITRYAQKSMHPLKWLSLYGPSGKYEWKWRSGRAFMCFVWGPPFRVLPHGSKQTSSRRVPLVLNSPCSQSIVCSHARLRRRLPNIKLPQKES